MLLPEDKIKELELIATEIRKDIISMLLEAGSGHSAGSLDMADVFTTLYFSGVLSWDPDDPWKVDRDRVLLCAGHICPVWYATLSHTGAFSHAELLTLRKINSRLQGHPHYQELPGIENTAGPLGQGISQGIGQALALKLDKSPRRVYVVMSDGEFQEGQVWEAYMFAGKNKLHTLTTLIDRNNIQIDGFTEDVMPLEPFADKLLAFNWNVIEIDGHNIREISEALGQAKAMFEKPTAIICHTIAGQGVDFMEGDYKWHGMPPNKNQAAKALSELRTLFGQIQHE